MLELLAAELHPCGWFCFVSHSRLATLALYARSRATVSVVCCYGLVVSTSTRGVFTPCDRVLVSFRFIDAPQLSRLIYRSLRLVAPRLRRIDGSFGYLKLRRLGPLPRTSLLLSFYTDFDASTENSKPPTQHKFLLNPRKPEARGLHRPNISSHSASSPFDLNLNLRNHRSGVCFSVNHAHTSASRENLRGIRRPHFL